MTVEIKQTIGGDPTSLLLEQLALAVDSGTPLHEVIDVLATDFGDRKMRRRLKKVANHLCDSSDSLEPIDILVPLFPPRFEPSLRLAIRTGKLPEILHLLARQESKFHAIKGRLWAILAYPITIIFLFLLIPLLFSLLVSDSFRDLFNEFGLELPIMTLAVLNLLDWTQTLYKVIAILLTSILMIHCYRPNIRWLHWFRTATPLFGRAWVWASHERFASQMAVLTNMGVPAVEALVATAEWLPDRHLSHVTYKVARKCREGSTIGQAMSESRHYETSLSTAVHAGEATGDLHQSLEESSIEYQQQLDHFSRFLSRVVPPVLTILIGGFVAVMIVALMIPLVGLIENLS